MEKECSKICCTCDNFKKFNSDDLKKHKYAEDGFCEKEQKTKSFWQKCD